MKQVFIVLIKIYQRYISPLKTTKCPYYPTCSQYGLEAIEKYGAIKGGFLALWRILRCNPFSKGGYDPVPWFLSLQSYFNICFNIDHPKYESTNPKRMIKYEGLICIMWFLTRIRVKYWVRSQNIYWDPFLMRSLIFLTG